MLDGIKVLIERMDSHPEEFFGDLAYRWAEVMQDIAKNGPQFLEEEDLMLLNKKVKEVRRKELNAKIMDEIANAERLNHAQEKFARAGKVQVSPYATAQAKSAGGTVQNAWWNSNTPVNIISPENAIEKSFDLAYKQMLDDRLKGSLVWMEEKKDEATLRNIRKQNAMLEQELAAVKREQEAKDNRSKAYKQRNNQKWFNR